MKIYFFLFTIALAILTPSCSIRSATSTIEPLKTPYQKREKSTLLNGKQAEAVLTQCSRPDPGKIDATWLPSDSEIAEMESRLNEVKKLKIKFYPDIAKELELKESYLQYAGVVVEGRKLIYINAFPSGYIDAFPTEISENWRESAMVVCDGGSAFWGVLYDPEDKVFFELNVNGEA